MNKIVFGILAVVFGVVAGVTDEEIAVIKTALRPIVEDCGKEYSVTWDDVLAASEAKKTDQFDPCFHACFFKKVGIINDEGKFVPTVGLTKGKELVKDTEGLNIKDGFTACTSINDVEVSDGDKGCERAKLLHACLKEKVPILPL